jgi:dolichol kinase
MRSRQAQVLALILVIVGCASAVPVIQFGERAYDRVFAMSNPDAQQWLDTHMQRAERCEFVFYVTGAFALATLTAFWKFQRAVKPLLAAVVIMTLVSVGLAGWISYAGGKVRHSEFRDGPPQALPPHEEGRH